MLIEPLDLEDLWPFLQEYQRIEGPPNEQWSPDALIAGVLQWVTLVIPRESVRQAETCEPAAPFCSRLSAPKWSAAQPCGMGPNDEPAWEALIAIPSERALQTVPRGRSVLISRCSYS